MAWNTGRGLLAACAAVGALALLAVASDEAEATHFWSGTLSWESFDEDPLTPEFAVRITGYIGFDTESHFGMGNCDAAKPEAPGRADGSLNVDEVPVQYATVIEYADPNPKDAPKSHCRYSARIVDPSNPKEGVLVLLNGKQPGDSVKIQYKQCCRENDQHPNNPNKYVLMETSILIGDPNYSPVIDFPAISKHTNHGPNGYGNHHCPQNVYCKFYIYASDPNNDTLTWRLAEPQEPRYTGPLFTQPPNFQVDKDTGLAVWDTAGISVGKIYSTQIIVEDGVSKVPVDFMIEVTPGCENGAKGEVDPDTGELICEGPTVPPPPPEECEAHPDADGCRPVPPKPADGKSYEHRFWPPPRNVVPLQPAASDSEPIASTAGDGAVVGLAGIDSDGDDIADEADLCPGSETKLNNDGDGDGRGDGCDDDDDGDGIIDQMDGCPYNPDPDCNEQSMGAETEGGEESSRGFFSPEEQSAVAPGAGSADVQEQTSRVASGWASYLLIALGVAFVVMLLVVGGRRR